MIALLLALATQAGTLVLCGESFELPQALARELAGSAPHLVLDFGTPGADPLARAGSPAVRPDLSGEWSAQREAALLSELARCGAIVVAAETWLSCWQHFKPEQKDSRLEQELRAALRAGRPLVATGAAASYCASWSLVTREEIRRVQRNPRREDPNLVATGLDLAQGWMVDCALQKQAGLVRLLRASRDFGNARALFLSGPVAWVVRGAKDEAELAGSGFAVVLDLAHARRSRDDLREGRLLVLCAGDRVRFAKEIEVEPRAGARTQPGWKALGLPFEPAAEPRPGLEYRFDWFVQR
jgi:hypothetical protein